MSLNLRPLSSMLTCLAVGFYSANAHAQVKLKIDQEVTKLGKVFASHKANANGATLHYIRGGTGPVVMLLHGFPENWSEYRKIMPRLAKKFTVIAVDLRGVGGSSASKDGYDAATLAKDIHDLADQLKLKQIYIAGHDIGGMVAYAYARLFPKNTSGVMIMNAPLPGIEPWEEVKAVPFLWHFGFHQTPVLPEKLIAGREFVYFREGFFDRFAMNSKAISNADVSRYAQAYSSPSQLHAGLGFYRAFPDDEKFNEAQKNENDVPIILAVSDGPGSDTITRTAESLRKHGCSKVSVEVIKDSGHFLVDEQPEKVADLIERCAAIQK